MLKRKTFKHLSLFSVVVATWPMFCIFFLICRLRDTYFGIYEIFRGAPCTRSLSKTSFFNLKNNKTENKFI